MTHTPDQLKHEAALRAVEYVQSGMALGLGSGTTAEHAVREIGRRVREEGLAVRGVPTSERVAQLARQVGIPLTTLEETPELDLTIDGADEVVLATLDGIKGLGGALLREKIVAFASREETFVVDESKIVHRLGQRAPVPVEVVQFGWSRTVAALLELGCVPVRRLTPSGQPFITDSGNYLIDCRFPRIDDPQLLSEMIICIVGVVEHGLFLGIANRVIVAGEGGVRVVEKS